MSPANDFSSLAPRRISYVVGGLITAMIGIVMMPWKLYADAAAYTFTWLIGYSSLMGASYEPPRDRVGERRAIIAEDSVAVPAILTIAWGEQFVTLSVGRVKS